MGLFRDRARNLVDRANSVLPKFPPPFLACRGRKVVAVRHADVASGANPPLSAVGQARANELVHVFEGAAPTKILVSDLVRTQQTAAPLALAAGVTPVVLAALDIDAYVSAINALPQWATVFVVGHSNTVPLIIGKLTGRILGDIPATEFDRLYVAVGAHHLELRYGAKSP